MADNTEAAYAGLPDFKRMHKEAFRTAFNYLEEHWPPSWDADGYWVPAAKEALAVTANSDGKNLLTGELMVAVYAYMSRALQRYWPRTEDAGPDAVAEQTTIS